MHGASLPRRRLLSAALLGAALGRRAQAASGRSVVDLAGRRVRLPEQIRRIASAGGSPAVNAFLFLFGRGKDIITGLPPGFQTLPWHLQGFFAPNIVNAPVVSGPPPAWTPNVESLLALRPDIAFVVDENAATLLERAGIAAIVLKWERNDSIERTVRLLAEIFADAPRAAAYFSWRDELAGTVARHLGELRQRPRVLYLRYATLTQPIRIPANQMIAQAGGVSVTAEDNSLQLDSFSFSLEQMLAWQPEVLLLAFGEERERLLADKRLADLPAIRNRQVFGVPHGAHIWTHYTPEQPLGILWLASRLFPARFGDVDLADESTRFYRRFFGKAPAPAEIAAILQ